MRASQQIGGDAPGFAIHTIKGNTPRGYDHRAHWTEMFDKVTSNTGTLESRPTSQMRVGEVLSPEEVVSAATSGKGRMSFVDTLGVCFFSTIGHVELLAAAVGLRIGNLARVYNSRVGHTRAHDFPSPRYGSTPTDGPFAG